MIYNSRNAVNGSFEFATLGVLGGDIAHRATFLHEPLQDELVLDQIDTLRKNITELNASSHPDDSEVLQAMCGNFLDCDYPDLPEALQNKIDRPVMDWLVEASKSDVLDLLRWNASRMKGYQTRLDKMLPDLQYNVTESTDRLIKYGLLPKIARPLVQQVMEEAQIVPLDSFEAGKYMCSGYFSSSAFLLGITHEYLQDGLWITDRDTVHVYRHEVYHGLHFLVDGGLSTLMPPGYEGTPHDDPAYTWLNEAWVEHQALAGENGYPFVLSPRERWDMGSYESYRILGSLSFREGPEAIPLELFGRAFLEPAYNPGKYRRELFKRMCSISADLELDLGHPHLAGAVARSLAAVPSTASGQVVEDWCRKIHAARGTEYTWDAPELPTEHATLIMTREKVADA